ncbi:hypothetical protein P7D22_15285 [Lichenihabitans sp. Uapishka_5]|uniref:hypothetical protein n=1 Tax=Lichenihabitans sp. Uapishka_5 TaxID=3037302 RepID=UPI0029E7EA4F|nr:hypothetical protein [Lichenihabitans sp. Uapishka_5]MDX7952532.1 hypothetical protein [Lichenihabitans sp. Uapishka_5]
MAIRQSSLWLVTGALLAATPAFAADDGYQDVFSSVVGAIGITKSDPTPEIDYRERAPLVLPPRMDLPRPSAEIAHPASWPTDPDVTRRNRAAADGRAPMANILGNTRDTLNKDEMMSGRSSGEPEAVRARNCGQDGNNRACLMMTPEQLQAESDHYERSNPDTKRDKVEAGVEPDRVYLTQPPKGYLKTSKTVKLTNDGPKLTKDASNPKSDLLYEKPKDEE